MKTKRAGRELNPTDAFRKKARQREIKRNKAERTYIRDAFGKAQDSSKLTELKNELEELIKVEHTGELTKLQKLRKRVVLEAYEIAVRKKKEDEIRQQQADEEGVEQQPQHAGLSSVPLPKPPPLPAGPKPGLPPPPMPPPLPMGPGPAAGNPAGLPILPPPPGPPPPPPIPVAASSSSLPVLPPPPGPPPAAAMLPPPPGPHQGFGGMPGMLPPPPGPPPMGGMLPPPMMPPPGSSILPPPSLPPPGSSILPPPLGPPPGGSYMKSAAGSISKPASGGAAAAGGTITGASTVAKRPLAHKDKTLTAMVPASVLVRREAAAKGGAAGASALDDEVSIGPGFGLAPMQKSGGGSRGQRQQPPPQMGRWGNAVSVTTVAAGASKPAAAGARVGGGGGGGAAAASAPKVDAKLADFMSSLKDLGAFE